MNKEDREKEQLLKEQVLYDLLFNKKVDKLGNLTVQQRDGFVVVDSGGKVSISVEKFPPVSVQKFPLFLGYLHCF